MQLHYVVVHIDVVALQDEVVMPNAAFLKDKPFSHDEAASQYEAVACSIFYKCCIRE